MSDTFDIKFFRATTKSSRLGGGYITSGGLKANFSVFENNKSKYGFILALPYRKGPDDKIVNEVQFTTQAMSEKAHGQVAELLGIEVEASPRVVTESTSEPRPSGPATSVDIKARVQKFGNKPPF
jgi:hypothetical protein